MEVMGTGLMSELPLQLWGAGEGGTAGDKVPRLYPGPPHTLSQSEAGPPQAALASSGQAQSLSYPAQMPTKLTDGNRPKLWAVRAHVGTTGPTVCRPC